MYCCEVASVSFGLVSNNVAETPSAARSSRDTPFRSRPRLTNPRLHKTRDMYLWKRRRWEDYNCSCRRVGMEKPNLSTGAEPESSHSDQLFDPGIAKCNQDHPATLTRFGVAPLFPLLGKSS